MHFNFNEGHIIVNLNNLHQFHANPNRFYLHKLNLNKQEKKKSQTFFNCVEKCSRDITTVNIILFQALKLFKIILKNRNACYVESNILVMKNKSNN